MLIGVRSNTPHPSVTLPPDEISGLDARICLDTLTKGLAILLAIIKDGLEIFLALVP